MRKTREGEERRKEGKKVWIRKCLFVHTPSLQYRHRDLLNIKCTVNGIFFLQLVLYGNYYVKVSNFFCFLFPIMIRTEVVNARTFKYVQYWYTVVYHAYLTWSFGPKSKRKDEARLRLRDFLPADLAFKDSFLPFLLKKDPLSHPPSLPATFWAKNFEIFWGREGGWTG